MALRQRPRLNLLAGLAVVTALTVATAPQVRFAYPASQLELVVETAIFIFASLAAGIVVGLFRTKRGLLSFDPIAAPTVVLIALSPIFVDWTSYAAARIRVTAAVLEAALFALVANTYRSSPGRDRAPRLRRLPVAAAVAAAGSASAVGPASGAGLHLLGDFLFLIASLIVFDDAMQAGRERAWQQARTNLVEREKELARELHDAMAQDLAFIVTYTSTVVARGEGPAMLHEVVAAAQRSLDESRRVMADLSSSGDRPVQGPAASKPQAESESVKDESSSFTSVAGVLVTSPWFRGRV